MLSESGPQHILRPRPPGSRRSSTRSTISNVQPGDRSPMLGTDEHGFGGLLPSPTLAAPKRMERAVSDSGLPGTIEQDLGLNLPSHLTAALEKSLHHGRKGKRHLSDADTRHVRPADVERDVVVTAQEDPSGPSTSIPTLDHMDQGPNQYEDQEARKQHRVTTSIDSTTSSAISLDADWVGGLSREELEQLLFQSRQIIKEREHDLGVAAAIGKALLEKNISLRDRHEGNISRFSSISNLHRLGYDPDQGSERRAPNNSPPQSDGDPVVLSRPNGEEKEEITPRPDEINHESDADFIGLQASPSAQRLARMDPSSGVAERHVLTGSSVPTYNGQAQSEVYVASRPTSPLQGLADSSFARLRASETHRRLELISLQNEELLDQLAQLEAESEEAKREGGKRQKRLIREIDGLRVELEASEARTLELEQKEEAQRKAQPPLTRQPWRRRGTLPYRDPQGSAADGPKPSPIAEAPRSESPLSQSSRSRPPTEIERAIVAQLMGKVRELEEINSALVRDAHERDGRIGRFVEDSERIHDLYEAVEHEAVASLSAATSMEELATVEYGSGADSPWQGSQRSPANRRMIAYRRAIREAVQNEWSPEQRHRQTSWGGSLHSSMISSNESSPNLANAVSRSHKLVRPRILITPSAEDLQAQFQTAERAIWENGRDPSHRRVRRLAGVSSDLSLHDQFVAHADSGPTARSLYHRSSDGDLAASVSSRFSFKDTNVQRTLGSELGSQYGGYIQNTEPQDDAPQQDGAQVLPSLSVQSTVSEGKTLRRTPSQTSLKTFSDSGSDIADLKWTNQSISHLPLDPDLADVSERLEVPRGVKERLLLGSYDRQDNAATSSSMRDRDWYPSVVQALLPLGSLRHDVETSHRTYTLLERLTSNIPVHWADDEDFGMPITERDARNLGLMERKSNSSDRFSRPGLLSWIAPKSSTMANSSDGNHDDGVPSGLRLESSDDVAYRQGLERLLRAKRIAALHERILHGQLTEEEARAKGAFDDLDLDDDEDWESQSVQEGGEPSRHSLLYRTMRRRSYVRGSIPSGSPNKLARSSSSQVSLLASGKEVRLLESGTPSKKGKAKANNDDGDDNSPPEWADGDTARPTTKGIEYYQVMLRERYRPNVVKQRVRQASTETVTWAMAWATFSIVMVLAFVSAFARGPKRILNSQ